MSKSRTKISDEAFERVATGLVEALEKLLRALLLPLAGLETRLCVCI